MRSLVVTALAVCLVAPVVSKTLAHVRTDAEALILTDVKDGCPDGTSVGVWGGRGFEPVTGCWFEAHGVVWIAFADGEKRGYPKSAFRWQEV